LDIVILIYIKYYMIAFSNWWAKLIFFLKESIRVNDKETLIKG